MKNKGNESLFNNIETIGTIDGLRRFKNVITRCQRCGGMIYWDENLAARILELSDSNVGSCLDQDCDLTLTFVNKTAIDYEPIFVVPSEPILC